MRVCEGIKAVLKEVFGEGMTEHLKVGCREFTRTGRGERNGYYTRNLVSSTSRIEDLQVPRDREGQFATEVCERYKRVSGNVEEAIREMHHSGIATRKIAAITDAVSGVRIGEVFDGY